METHKEKLAKLAKGPGVFVYLGGAYDHEWKPTPKLSGKKEPLLTAEGMPVMDRSGRQIYKPAGEIQRDDSGQPIMGGIPEKKRIEVKVFSMWGVEFPKGEKVGVSNEALALKLRARSELFDEIEGAYEEIPEPPQGAGKIKRRKYRKRAASDRDVVKAVEDHEAEAAE